MALHVSYIDESDKGGPLFTVGALMAKAEEQWMPFVDLWQSILDEPPALQYFTLKDKQGLSDESHWAKVDAFIDLINEMQPRGALQLIHTCDFQDFYRGKMSATYDNPFQMGYIAAIQQCALWRLEPDAVIDWVLDEVDDTQYLEILDSYRALKRYADPDVAKRLGRDPIRMDDKQVIPLQAADLWAGLMRRGYQGDAKAQECLDKIEIPYYSHVWTREWLEHVWAQNVALHPNLPTGKLYEGRKERSKRLAEDRKVLRFPPKR